jgi:hypothetical protein
MAATLLGLRIGSSECVKLSYMHLACRSHGANQAERQRVSRQLASLVNTFTNYRDVKGGLLKNSERVSELTLSMSGFFEAPGPMLATVSYQSSAEGDWLPPSSQLSYRWFLPIKCRTNKSNGSAHDA